MTNLNERSSRPSGEVRDELDDSWFDLPIIAEAAPAAITVKPARREAEAELDESWFDRPGHGIRRSDVLGAGR
jgi:hypothetical protein